MILKTLWAHRKQNGFVFAEIILITVLSFYFIDQLVVTTYDIHFCRPVGDFEREHLLVAQVGDLSMPEEKQDTAKVSLAALYALRDQIQALSEVQNAALVNDFIGAGGDGYNYISTFSSETDSTCRCGARQRGFLLHEKYFETQGLTPIEGSPSAAQLSDECPEDGAVISRSMALALFGTDQVVGRRIMEWDFSDRALREKGGYTPVKHYTVAGVLEDFRLLSYERYAYSILVPQTRLWNLTSQMLIRLRPEVDAEAFVSKMKDTMKEELRSCNLALVSLKTYPEYQKEFAFGDQVVLSTLIGLMLGLLLVNVMLGTLGTYWLQLRKRTEDIGILRSFGAKRRNIFWMVWSEITLLTLIACIIGQIIWMQFAINFGLSKGQTMTGNGQETDWVNNFWLHFLIICVIQYLLMLVIVTLGIIIPALIAMYRKPINALRHE